MKAQVTLFLNNIITQELIKQKKHVLTCDIINIYTERFWSKNAANLTFYSNELDIIPLQTFSFTTYTVCIGTCLRLSWAGRFLFDFNIVGAKIMAKPLDDMRVDDSFKAIL